MFHKKGAVKNFAEFTGKHQCQSQSLLKLYQKEALADMFFREFCKIFKNTFLTEHFRATASGKPIVFRYFQGVSKGNIGKKLVKTTSEILAILAFPLFARWSPSVHKSYFDTALLSTDI